MLMYGRNQHNIVIILKLKIKKKIILESVGEGEGGMMWENGIETCKLSYVK